MSGSRVVPLRPRSRAEVQVPEAPRVMAAFGAALLRVPPKPVAFTTVVAWLQEPADRLAARPMAMRALENLRTGLFSAPGREAEMALLWREAVATACFARLLAAGAAFDAPLLTGLGLLHRTGEIVALKALAQAENAAGQRIVGPVMQEILEARDDELLARVTRGWSLPGELRLLLLRWRAEQESPQCSPPVALLTLAQALATEVVHAATCVPGLVEAAREALHLPAGLVAQAEASRDDITGLLAGVAPG